MKSTTAIRTAALAAAAILALDPGGGARTTWVWPDPREPVPVFGDPVSSVSSLVPVAGPPDGAPGLVFSVASGPGQGLYRTEGKWFDTRFVVRPWPQDAGLPASLVAHGGRAWFLAGAQGGGKALYRSDGTSGGTGVVASLGNGTPGGALVSCGDHLFIPWIPSGGTDTTLLVSDGTEAGTHPVRSDGLPRSAAMVPSILVWPFVDTVIGTLGSRLLFFGETPAEGSEPWVSDGTEEGTRLLRDIFPGPEGSAPQVPQFVVSGSLAYFVASTEGQGAKVWRTDGTPEGTLQVPDPPAGPAPSGAWMLGSVAGRIVFSADDGVHGRGLWATGGSAEGTVFLREFPGVTNPFPMGLGEVGGRFLFTLYDAGEPETGALLWGSDGTTAGTSMLGQLGNRFGTGWGFRSLPGTGVALFSSLWSDGMVSFRTDGTLEGTWLVAGNQVLAAWRGGYYTMGNYLMDYRGLERHSYGDAGLSESAADEDGDGFSDELEAFSASDPADAASTPFGGAWTGVPEGLHATRADIAISRVRYDEDSLVLEGRLPFRAGMEFEDPVVTVDAGGVIRSFLVGSDGRSMPPGNQVFRLRIPRRGGESVDDPAAPFRMHLLRRNLSQALGDEDLWPEETVRRAPRTLPVTVLWDGRVFRASLPLEWTAGWKGIGRARLARHP